MDHEQNSTVTQVRWAPQSWFTSLLSGEDGAAYFGHSHNGYQLFRHAQLIHALEHDVLDLVPGCLLDVGCATGVLTDNIRCHFSFKKAVGVDFVPEVLEIGRQFYTDVEFHEGSLPLLPFGTDSFDLVVASEVLYYLTPDAQRLAVDQIDLVLHSGGYFLVGAALGGDYFSQGCLIHLLGKNFEIVTVMTQHMYYYHKLVAPFYYATRLENLIKSGMMPGSNAMKLRFERILPFVNFFPIRLLLKFIVILGRPILANRQLPTIINFLCRLSRPTNITVVARKK